jgi:hypothetical protein
VYYALDDAHVAGVIAEMLRHAAEEAPAGDASARRSAATRGPRSAAVAR